MIDKTKKDFVMISQWGIGKSGRGVWFFDHLKHGKLNHYMYILCDFKDINLYIYYFLQLFQQKI